MSLPLDLVTELTVELSPPHEMGEAPAGTRRIIPIIGGTATGPRLNGRILNVGADWQTVTANGIAHLDARYAIRTDDGAVIEVVSQGIRHANAAGETYMRTAIRLETGDPRFDWVNRALFLAAGSKADNTVRLSVYQVG